MTNLIPETAIQAAAEALIPYSGAMTNRELQASVAISTALPYIRKEIVEELLKHIPSPLHPRASLTESFIDVGMMKAVEIIEDM